MINAILSGCILMFIDITEEIFNAHNSRDAEKVFFSNSFDRRVLKKSYRNGELAIIQDHFGESGYVFSYFSFFFNKDTGRKIQFVINSEKVKQERILDKTWIHVQKNKKSFLIPDLPIIRYWNDKKKITHESANYYTRHDDHLVVFEVQPITDGSFELLVLEIPTQELFSLCSVYRNSSKKYTLTGPWVVISPLLDCWRFMVNGKIYEYREETTREASARYRSQQAALFLYKLVDIQADYAKELVKIIKDEIAYSVMLDLESDGRWVHGCWTDEMETHTRFQADGIHLLLDHFNETKEDIFLEKAVHAMKYLLSIADPLNEECLWFIHDTLELKQSYISPLIKSRAYGKSENNSLCLNTHLTTLCALFRLYILTKNEEIKAAMGKGLKAAEMVLGAEPATSLYGILYHLIDFSFETSCTFNNKSGKVSRLRDILVRKLAGHAEMMLPRVKRAFPRFVMPNGFVTRHLSIPREGYHYHIINLYDMLVLYQLLYRQGYRDTKWLWDKIEKGVSYCLKGHLTGFLIKNKDKFIPQLVEVLVLYSAFSTNFDKKVLVDLVLKLVDEGFRFTSGSYGFDNLITPEEYQVPELSLGNNSADIESLNVSPREKKFKELLVINTGTKKEEIDIVLKSNSNKLEVISSNGQRINPPILLGSRDYLLIKLYDH